MTTPIAYTLGKLERGATTDRRLRTFATALAERLDADFRAETTLSWPSPRYRSDPVGFFRDILGVQPWSLQIAMLEMLRDSKRVAIASGHKVSKSHTIAGASLWRYTSFADARVVLTSTTERQVDDILWRELRMLHAGAGICAACKARNEGQRALVTMYDDAAVAALAEAPEWDAMAWRYGQEIPSHAQAKLLHGALAILPDAWHQARDVQEITAPCPHSALIDGEPATKARGGLTSGFRAVYGFSAKETEAAAGISGQNLWYFVDEASGVDEGVFDALEGNRAGGAGIALFGNPTKNRGELFEAFHGKSKLFTARRISGEETPNALSGRTIIPGLCERAFVEEKEIEHGRDSTYFRVRVKGEHPIHEEGCIFPLGVIAEAQQRWFDAPAVGRLAIGVDPAGASGTGDDSAFCVRRGHKVLELYTVRGLDEAGHCAHISRLAAKHRQPSDGDVLVVLDREGKVGYAVYSVLATQVTEQRIELLGMRVSEKAHREAKIYARQRDALASNLENWFRDGGAITDDDKLESELHAMRWETNLRGQLKLIAKEKIRQLLGRSPDRFDSLALAVWEPLDDEVARKVPQERRAGTTSREETFDPFDGLNQGNSAGEIDPYG